MRLQVASIMIIIVWLAICAAKTQSAEKACKEKKLSCCNLEAFNLSSTLKKKLENEYGHDIARRRLYHDSVCCRHSFKLFCVSTNKMLGSHHCSNSNITKVYDIVLSCVRRIEESYYAFYNDGNTVDEIARSAVLLCNSKTNISTKELNQYPRKSYKAKALSKIVFKLQLSTFFLSLAKCLRKHVLKCRMFALSYKVAYFEGLSCVGSSVREAASLQWYLHCKWKTGEKQSGIVNETVMSGPDG